MVAPFKTIDLTQNEILDAFPDAEEILMAAYGAVTDEIFSAYQSTWSTWDEKPQIALTQVAPGRYNIIFDDSEASKNWEHADKGSADHPRSIVPRPDNQKGLLIFNRDYTPRTRPGSLSSGQNAKTGPIQRRTEIPRWWVEARDFSGQIETRANAALERAVARMQNQRLTRRSLRGSVEKFRAWLGRGFVS